MQSFEEAIWQALGEWWRSFRTTEAVRNSRPGGPTELLFINHREEGEREIV